MKPSDEWNWEEHGKPLYERLAYGFAIRETELGSQLWLGPSFDLDRNEPDASLIEAIESDSKGE